MALDPLKPRKDDGPYVRQRKIAARNQLDDLLFALKTLGFTRTTHMRSYFLRCRHGGKFTYKLGRTLEDRGSWNIFAIRAAHRRCCGKET
jgi:hypothetical protein